MRLKPGPTSPPDSHALVHPELREALAALLARDPPFPGGPDDDVTPEELAALLPALRQAWAADASHVPWAARSVPVTQRTIPGPGGAPNVLVHVVGGLADEPRDGPRPAILHMHGGGFIVGTAAEYLPVLQAQALAVGCVIVSVEYRLAPETPFPGALEDNHAALRWLHAHAAELGVDPARIAVQGESAGGGHAAALALLARDRGEVPVLFQALTYPMIDDRTGSARPVPPHVGSFGWTPRYNRMGWSAYLGQPAGGPDVPSGAVPARAEDLTGLPPAFIWVGSTDLFVDEDVDYARRLVQAGVPVELHVLPGAYHGFDGAAPGAAVTLAYKLLLVEALARTFGTTPHPATRSLLRPDVDALGSARAG